MYELAFLPGKQLSLTQNPSRWPQTHFELDCFHLGSSSGLVRKTAAPASLPLVWPAPCVHVLDFGSVPEDTEVSYLASEVFNGKSSLLISRAKNNYETVQWTRKNNTMFVWRANSGRPARAPKMEKTNHKIES